MRKILLWMLLLVMGSTCYAQDITIRYKGKTAKVEQKVKDSVDVSIYDASGTLIDSVTIPFSLKRSASLVSSPAFKVGNSYTVKTKGYEKTFTLSEPFTTVR